MKTIFSPFKLGPHVLKNRLVALPIFTGYAFPSGQVSPVLIEHYSRLSASGVAMVVVANVAVAPDGTTSKYNLRIDDDRFVPGLARLAQAVKSSGALACLQLNHAGRLTNQSQPLLPSPYYAPDPKFELFSLKAFIDVFPLELRLALTRKLFRQILGWRRGMTAEDRSRVIACFGDAAKRAHEAGFDMIELHGASGYLITQFLSAYTNKLPDAQEDTFEDRTVFPLAVMEEVKRRLPGGFPVGFRLLVHEWVPHGINMEEALAWARLLENRGIAYLSVTAGTYNSFFLNPVRQITSRPAYLWKDAALLHQSLKVPIVISGRILTPSLAEELVRSGAVSLIGLGRPLLADVRWVQKAADGRPVVQCDNCFHCLKNVILDRGVVCTRWPRFYQKSTELKHRLLDRKWEKALMIASEPADIEAIRTALNFFTPADPRFEVTIRFLAGKDNKTFDHTPIQDHVAHFRQIFAQQGHDAGHLRYDIQTAERSYDDEISSFLEQDRYGFIMLGRPTRERWQKRLLYQQRGKAVALVAPGDPQRRFLIALDLSDASLLVLKFVQYFFIDRPENILTFVHVLEDSPEPAHKWWKRARRIMEWDDRYNLALLPARNGVAADLMEAVRSGNHHSLILGKKGRSGIKRWLLGSVSGTLSRNLNDVSLFLID
ncbi:MAG: hypothetical protein Q8P24_01680 [Desulfobacterales bacterium]|nr:hypothetical protein [Desulfobacterales bacterium]